MSDTAPVSFNSARQIDIYRRAPREGETAIPFDYETLRQKAIAATEHHAFTFVDGGAGCGDTMTANEAAFKNWQIVPRMLRDISKRDISVNLLGKKRPTPLLLAPIGVQSGMHPDGEIATAKAAASLGIPFVLSTVATTPMEHVAQVMGDAERWYQLYWSNDRELTKSLLQRAGKSGYTALVVTLDTQTLGWRPRDLTNAHLPFLKGLGLANYMSDPVFKSRLKRPPEEDMEAVANLYLEVFSDLSHTWEDLAFLRENTSLPIIVKGIQHADDAIAALDAGMDAVWVSNHGGRQVDGAIGQLDALVPVAKAVKARVPVLFCSGIRRGADIYKAIALGADMVGIGRPYMYGLAVNGEQGVREVLADLLAEFDLTMGLSGQKSLAEITSDCLVPSKASTR